MTDNDLESLSEADDSNGGTTVSATPDEAKANAGVEEAKGREPAENNEGRLSGRASESEHTNKPKEVHDE